MVEMTMPETVPYDHLLLMPSDDGSLSSRWRHVADYEKRDAVVAGHYFDRWVDLLHPGDRLEIVGWHWVKGVLMDYWSEHLLVLDAHGAVETTRLSVFGEP